MQANHRKPAENHQAEPLRSRHSGQIPGSTAQTRRSSVVQMPIPASNTKATNPDCKIFLLMVKT